MSEQKNIPVHVAMILDGNGRWAKKRLMPRTYGHRKEHLILLILQRHAMQWE